MKLGMIARADDGGLGAQTWEFWRHLQPDLTVLIDLGAGSRGAHRPERYEQAEAPSGYVVTNEGNRLDRRMIKALMLCDVVYTAETFYHDQFWQHANAQRLPTVLHANPELYIWQPDNRPTNLWLPTPWQRHRFPPDAIEVPSPVALDRFTYRQRTEARTFLHIASPAMLDRNGTRAVLNALQHVREPCRLIMVGTPPQRCPRHPRVTVEWMNEPAINYWELYRDDVDVLLLPRRYAGLCLPVQEAAACGIPSVMTDIEPNDWYTHLRVPVRADAPPKPVEMKGGWFNVYDPDPEALARMIDELVTSPQLVRQASVRAGLWARTHSWGVAQSRIRRLLTQIVEANQ